MLQKYRLWRRVHHECHGEPGGRTHKVIPEPSPKDERDFSWQRELYYFMMKSGSKYWNFDLFFPISIFFLTAFIAIFHTQILTQRGQDNMSTLNLTISCLLHPTEPLGLEFIYYYYFLNFYLFIFGCVGSSLLRASFL